MTGIGFIGIMLLIAVIATLAYMAGWRDCDLAHGHSKRERALRETERKFVVGGGRERAAKWDRRVV